MGRKSRLKWERRKEQQGIRVRQSSGREAGEAGRTPRLKELIGQLNQLHDGNFEMGGSLPPERREAHLEQVLAFESVGTGTSLFQGLEEHGIKLPRPENLNEMQCIKKVTEVGRALAKLGVMLVGFEHMDPKTFYSTLWNETLWEGCYLEKRDPDALTFIDVSHSMSKADWRRFMEELNRSQTVQ